MVTNSSYNTGMIVGYLHWQLFVAPVWLLEFLWTLQRALWKYFSVPVMVLTLFAPWRQDQISIQQGSISGMLKAVLLNIISRFVGLFVRVLMLLFFGIAEGLFVPTAVLLLGFVLLWPVVAVWLVMRGATQLFSL